MLCILDDLLDELAIKLKLSVKGHAGIKPCFRCANVIMKDHPLVTSHASFRCLSDLNPSNFIPVKDEELWAAQDNLIHMQPILLAANAKGRFERLETSCGQICEPLGLMADKSLRPYVLPTKTRFDPFHCYMVNGAAAVEVDLLVDGLYKHGFKPDAIEAYVNDRFRPSQSLKFTTNGLKGMGSDVHRAVFVLAHLCCEILQPRNLMEKEVNSFLALFEVVKTMQEMKLMEPVSQELKDRLALQQRLHVDKHKEAYGNKHIKPKHHYGLHIPKDINHVLIDTAPCERKERLIKDQIQRIPKCRGADNVNIHLTVGVNLVQLDEMERAPKFGSLEGAISSFQNGDLQGSCARRCVTTFGIALVAGDVLVFEAVPHVLLACVVLDECLNFLVQPCSRVRAHGAGSIWMPLDARMLLQESVVPHIAYVRFFVVTPYCFCLETLLLMFRRLI